MKTLGTFDAYLCSLTVHLKLLHSRILGDETERGKDEQWSNEVIVEVWFGGQYLPYT